MLRPGDRPIGVIDWGGGPTPIVLLHPNGFCAGVFEPIARALPARFRPVAIDLRGHGASWKADHPRDLGFLAMAEDVAFALDTLEICDAVVVGSSLGGGVAVLLDHLRPGMAARMLLCEPGALPAEARPTENPMLDVIRRRRRVWPDLATMKAAYTGRGGIGDLEPGTLDAYLRWGTRRRPDGQVELVCDPLVEAMIASLSYAPEGAPAAWAHLPRLEASAYFVGGTESFFPADSARLQAAEAASPYRLLDGGHLAFFGDVARAVELIEWACG